MTPTSVGMRCPECAPQRGRASRVVSSRVATDVPVVTYALIVICVLVELGVLAGGGDFSGSTLGTSPFAQQGPLVGTLVGDGDVWRLVTSGFMHAGLLHLVFNMFSLWILGSLLEPAIGRVRFAVIFFVSLLAGSFGVLIVDPTQTTVGASGAVFGLMAAAIVIMRNRGIDPMASGLPFWLGLNLLFTFSNSNLSVGGHIGGLIGGALAALVMYELPSRIRGLPRQAPPLLGAAVGVAAVVGSLLVV
ncbi:MAG: hypothetical protein QOJ07_1471 [Thermoleophilaceae bacterium]|nr:hypothetical protein [Thermoleophilaceae bacterium]